MAEYKFQIKTINGEIQLGSAAKIPFSQGNYGSVFWTPLRKARKYQIRSLESKFSSIAGWNDLTKEQQEDVTKTLIAISTNVTPVKRSRSSGSVKSPAKKAKTMSKKKQSKKKEKDPNAPKRPLTAFFLWSSRARKKYVKENPQALSKDIMKALGAIWKAIDEKEKKKWKDLQIKAREIYDRQLAEYTEKGTFTAEELHIPFDDETEEEKENHVAEKEKGETSKINGVDENKKEETSTDESKDKSAKDAEEKENVTSDKTEKNEKTSKDESKDEIMKPVEDKEKVIDKKQTEEKIKEKENVADGNQMEEKTEGKENVADKKQME